MVSRFVYIYCFYIMVTWHYNLNIRLHTKSLHPPPAHAVQVCLAVRIIIYGQAQYIPGLSRYIYMCMGTTLLSFVCFCLVLFCSFLFFFFVFCSVLTFQVISFRKVPDYQRIIRVPRATRLPDPILTITVIATSSYLSLNGCWLIFSQSW